MVLLFSLFVGGVLWAAAMQVMLQPVANRHIFGVVAACLVVVGFGFVWLTTLAWCAVERSRVYTAGGHRPRQPDGAGWFWQGVLLIVSLWLGTGELPSDRPWSDPRGPLGMLGAIALYGLAGVVLHRFRLPERLGRGLAPLLPIVVGLALYGLLNVLIDQVGLGTLLEPFNEGVRSTAVFVVIAALVALMLGWLLRRTHGEAPDDAHVAYVPRPATVGWAMFPMLAPVFAFACLHLLPMDPWWRLSATATGQVGLMLHAMLVPLFPAALMVAWGLDRRDGSSGSWLLPSLCAGALLIWIAVGPELLWSYHPAPDITASQAAEGSPTDPFWGWDPAAEDWVPLPLDGLIRACGAMMLALALLAVHLIRRVGRGFEESPIPALIMLLVLQVSTAALLLPKFGPLGAPLGTAIAAVTVWLFETWNGGARHEHLAVAD